MRAEEQVVLGYLMERYISESQAPERGRESFDCSANPWTTLSRERNLAALARSQKWIPEE
jgi:hypothetical protein